MKRTTARRVRRAVVYWPIGRSHDCSKRTGLALSKSGRRSSADELRLLSPSNRPESHRETRIVSFADHSSGVSAAYAAFRPRYPDALFDFLAHEAPALDAAWDCGTGSGQAAIGLARHFHEIFATDASESQLEHAMRHPRIAYRVASAEASGLRDASVGLVAAAQALHWFDRPRFWAEARRVLRPRGVIAVWADLLFGIAPDIDAIVRDFYSGTVGPFWPPERRITEERYRTIEFPFAEFAAPPFQIEQHVTLDDVTGNSHTCPTPRTSKRRQGRITGEAPTTRLPVRCGVL